MSLSPEMALPMAALRRLGRLQAAEQPFISTRSWSGSNHYWTRSVFGPELLDHGKSQSVSQPDPVFSFSVAGVSSDTRVTAASFSFGTDPGDDVPGNVCTGDCGTTTQSTPEPVSFLMVGAGLICASVLTKLRHA